MLQVTTMTKEEKYNMYMKFSKRELTLMLMENQRIVEMYTKPLIVS